MKLKTLFLLTITLVLGACASQQQEEEDIPRMPAEDPNVVALETANYKLYNQTPAQMYRSLKLPSINYDFDSIRAPEYAYPLLDKVALVMQEHENLHLILQGNCDSVGTDEYNYWLSGARAAGLKSYLVSRGINAERIRIHAYGNTRPVTLDQSPEGRRANRRVDMQFTVRRWKSIY